MGTTPSRRSSSCRAAELVSPYTLTAPLPPAAAAACSSCHIRPRKEPSVPMPTTSKSLLLPPPPPPPDMVVVAPEAHVVVVEAAVCVHA